MSGNNYSAQFDSGRIFEKVSNSNVNKTCINFNKKIHEKQRDVSNYFLSSFGDRRFIKKPAIIAKLEQQLKKKFFNPKNGVLIDFFPKLRGKLIKQENEKQNHLEDKINLGEMTYLLTENGSTSKAKEKAIKRKLLMISPNFNSTFSPNHKNTSALLTKKTISPKGLSARNSKKKKNQILNMKKAIDKSNFTLSSFSLDSNRKHPRKCPFSSRTLNSAENSIFQTELKDLSIISPPPLHSVFKKKSSFGGDVMKLEKLTPTATPRAFKLEDSQGYRKTLLQAYTEKYKKHNPKIKSYHSSRPHSLMTFPCPRKVFTAREHSRIISKEIKDEINTIETNVNKLGKDLLNIIDKNDAEKTKAAQKGNENHLANDMEAMFGLRVNKQNPSAQKTLELLKTNPLANSEKYVQDTLHLAVENLTMFDAMKLVDQILLGAPEEKKAMQKREEQRKLNLKLNQEEEIELRKMRKRIQENSKRISRIQKSIIFEKKIIDEKFST